MVAVKSNNQNNMISPSTFLSGSQNGRPTLYVQIPISMFIPRPEGTGTERTPACSAPIQTGSTAPREEPQMPVFPVKLLAQNTQFQGPVRRNFPASAWPGGASGDPVIQQKCMDRNGRMLELKCTNQHHIYIYMLLLKKRITELLQTTQDSWNLAGTANVAQL